jgi:two-component system, sporulation sensor kinase D
MPFSKNKNISRWAITIISFVIILLILWNTYTFFQIFKNEERVKMQHWAEAQKTLKNVDTNTDIELPLQIIQNANNPIIVTEADTITNWVNVDNKFVENKIAAKAYLLKLQSQNEPITLEYYPGKIQKFYYGDSSLLTKLKYYPLALILIIVLFATVVYNFYQSTKLATQNKLWAGMAKETAHQIGTPLSSLIGWLEIMKADNVDQTTINEIEKDIIRLQNITDRFSKIGSIPVLTNCDIVLETKNAYDYLIARFSNQIQFTFSGPNVPLVVAINSSLHSWTIENLIKNAIDSMKGKGEILVVIENEGQFVKIKISDTGKGIPKKQFKSVFEPGFTTKKRGWGLGLSLTKRIVEEYHKGKIKVLKSEINVGTTMQMTFKIVN